MQVTTPPSPPLDRRDLISAPLVRRLRDEGFPPPDPPSRYYPDGSLWPTDRQTYVTIHTLLESARTGYGNLLWRALAPFGSTLHTVLYPGIYNVLLRRFDESGVVATPSLNPPSREEHDLGQIRVKVQLHRKFSRAAAEDLASAVLAWFTDVGAKGVFGERGMSAISPVVHYLKKDASFTLDMRDSGQETLNSMVLAILNWAMNTRRPLYWIAMAIEEWEPVLKSEQSVPLANGAQGRDRVPGHDPYGPE